MTDQPTAATINGRTYEIVREMPTERFQEQWVLKALRGTGNPTLQRHPDGTYTLISASGRSWKTWPASAVTLA